jgi:4-amino-4-deoxy-L-arabinose transferase-like glycosyltransferase
VLLLWWSHRAASDLGLAALTTVSLAALWLAADQPPGRRRGLLFLLGYFAAGLGMLYKLPMPLAVVGAPAFLYLLLRNRWSLLASRWHLLGLVVFLLPWLPWAFAAYAAEDGALLRWKVEFLDRFTGDLPNYEDRTNRVKEFFTYLTPTLLYTLPFTLSLPAAFYRGFRPPAGVKRDGTLFMLIWFAALLVFFTASSGKEERYFLPALPPLFVLLGIELAALFDPQRPHHPVLARVAGAAIVVALPAALLGGGLFGLHRWWQLRGSLELVGVATWADVRFAYLVTALILILGGYLSLALYLRRRGPAAFGTLVATMYVLWLWTWPHLLPLVMSARPYQDYAAQLQQAPRDLLDELRCLGWQDSRVVWYGDLRMPRVVDPFELLREQRGSRSAEYERRRIAEATLTALAGSEPVLLTARYIDFLPLLIEAPPALAREGRTMPPLHVWAQTRVGTEDQQHVLFGNRPPPRPPTGLVVPPERLRKLAEKGYTLPPELLRP